MFPFLKENCAPSSQACALQVRPIHALDMVIHDTLNHTQTQKEKLTEHIIKDHGSDNMIIPREHDHSRYPNFCTIWSKGLLMKDRRTDECDFWINCLIRFSIGKFRKKETGRPLASLLSMCLHSLEYAGKKIHQNARYSCSQRTQVRTSLRRQGI
jgi:hypothetical protein